MYEIHQMPEGTTYEEIGKALDEDYARFLYWWQEKKETGVYDPFVVCKKPPKVFREIKNGLD